MSQPLDLLDFPLWGSRLIEASAGTGKTFTLALLYTRLVLGHGGEDAAFDRPLTPPEILVVTFTDAATQELRDRIRLRLVEAAVCFETDPDAVEPRAPGEDALHDLRASYPTEQWLGCARRLRLAADWMDEAVISTIHGWCNRMLQEHAFDTRGLFDRELVTDQSDLIAEVVRDYWRLHFYPLTPDLAAGVLDVVKSPADLEAKLKDWIGRRHVGFSYKGDPLHCEALDEPLRRHCAWLAVKKAVEAETEEIATRMTELEQTARERWRADLQALEQHLRKLRPHLNGTAHGSTHAEPFDALLGEIARWSEGGTAPGKLKNLAQGAFRFKKTAPVQSEMTHPAFQAIADWQAAGGETPDLPEPPEPAFAAVLLAHAAGWIGPELERRLLRRAEMGFDDLLRQLDAALDPVAGEHAARLAETIRRQFPVALIDEFQDTDPIQYRIFDRIYAVRASRRETALVMIGDPKQAIYSFRGADIHAYLAAREATVGRHYTLIRNYRSTQALVDGCNRILEQAEQQARGAFRFRAGEENPIPFLPVLAKGRQERLILDGQEAKPITLWTLEDGENAVAESEYRARMADSAATQIAHWLEQARAGRSGFRHADRVEPLRPKDIAILVRSRGEAARMREALAARRIASVYLSDRDSVFQTQEAADLLHWLHACAEPTDESLVRAALGTNTLAIPLTELARLIDDELDWEHQVERFRDYRRIWQRQGVLAMLRRLMQDTELPARLIGRDDGERILTNLLHLAEWLQQSASALDGEQALIRHLSEHIDASGDEYILRLESDAELVQVVTIHKSKGLEYPLVLLPFICSWREVDGHTRQVPYRIGGQRVLEVAGKKSFERAWHAANDERLSEDMRLLYVALTRARHGLWLGIAPLKKGRTTKVQLERSAMGHVLNGGQPFQGAAAVWESLDQLGAACPHLAIELAPEARAIRLDPEHDARLDPARDAPDIRRPAWWITSYSALKTRASAPVQTDEEPPAPPVESAETAVEETTLEETGLVPAATDPRRLPPDARLHGLPRGSRYGTFLHGILEWAAAAQARDADGRPLHGFAAAAQAREPRREMLGQRCNLRRLTDWIEPLDAWLETFLQRRWDLRDLPGEPSVRLSELPPHRVQVEMEFWIESRRVDIGALDRLVRAHVQAGHARPVLDGYHINGMLKGFIDLVFEHEGRYYVVDWKSNWLGPDDAAYSPDAMREAVLHARYDLQYVLYLLALHRQLKARLPGYDYDRHLGGAVYVFLRGGHAESQGLFMDRPSRVLIETLDRIFAGERVTLGEDVA